MLAVSLHAEALMNALGPRTDAIDWIGFDAEAGAWSIRFTDDALLLLEWFGEQECLVVHASLGAPPPHAMTAVHQAALAFNAAWRDNAGARIGLADPCGELALLLDVPTQSLALEQLQQILLGMKSLAAVWARCVANPGLQPTPGEGMPMCLLHRV
jgi:hypothetical protein